MRKQSAERSSAPHANLFQAVGGMEACRQLSTAFYTRVMRDPLLRPFFPGKSFRCAIEAFAAFLVQILGGPSADTQFRWWLSLRESHLRYRIGPNERDAWLNTMIAALDDVPMAEAARGALLDLFTRSSAYVVNQGQAAPVAADRAKESCDPLHQEMVRRWDAQRTLDEIVAAVRRGDADRAIALAESSSLPIGHVTVFAGLLGQMIASGHDTLLAYVCEKVTRTPTLAHECYADRTLLHAAAAHANLGMVELLLRLGADPNGGCGHGPLCCLANACLAGGGPVVHALVHGGARVDAQDNVKRCTALHMAARRGNVEVAAALLDCGADIEARDSLGETPLRRAVNCNKVDVVALLLSRGADRHSIGSKGLTPLQAARTGAMKRLLQDGRPR